MSEIFISYAREDLHHAKTLATVFQEFGWSVFWDKEIPAGKVFDEVIEEKLRDVKCVIVIWTHNSVSSRWVKVEAGEGASRNILVPVLFEDVAIPLAFRNIQAANLTDWDGINHTASFHDLTQDISSLLGKPAPDNQSDIVREKEAKARAEEEARLKLEAEARWKEETEQRLRKEVESKFSASHTPQVTTDPENAYAESRPTVTSRKKWIVGALTLVLLAAALITWKLTGSPDLNDLKAEVNSSTIAEPVVDRETLVDDSIWNQNNAQNDTNKLKNFIEFRPNSKHAGQANYLLDSLRRETRKNLDTLLAAKTASERKATIDSVSIRGVDADESLTVTDKISLLKDSSRWKTANSRLYDSVLGKYSTINETQAALKNPKTDFITCRDQMENRTPVGITKQFLLSGGVAQVTVFAFIDAHNGAETLTVTLNPPNASPYIKTFSVQKSARYPTWRQFSVTKPGDYELRLTNKYGNLIGHIYFTVNGSRAAD